MNFVTRANRFLRSLSNNWPAKAISVGAAIIMYLLVGLNNMEERYISVPIRVQLPDDLVAAQEYPSFARVYLRGEGEGIFRISEDEIQITADFTQYGSPGVYRVALEHRRLGMAESVEPLEVRIEPGLLSIELQAKSRKVVDVIPRFSGSPASGYELASYSVFPSSVEVYGPEGVLEEIVEVETESIELGGQDGSFSTRVPLIKPHPLVHFDSTSIVDFRADISESILVNTFENVPVSVIGLDSRFSVEIDDVTGSIRAQAGQSLIDRTSPEAISLVVDAGDIDEPGEYTLPVRPVVPRGFVIFRFDPLELVLQVEPAGSGGSGQQDSGGAP